jgi:hypothetical protein
LFSLKLLSAASEAVKSSVAMLSGRRPKPIGEVGVLPGVAVRRREKVPVPKPKSLEKERVLKRYDKAFADMLSRHGAKSRLENLEKIKPLVYELSPDIRAWTGDMRIRVYMLLQEIAKDLSDPEYARVSLGILVLVLMKGGNSALEMARPIFSERIHMMYDDPQYENERFLPRLVLMLDGYNPQRVKQVAKEAIHVWNDGRFEAARQYLGFEELPDRALRNTVKGLLGGEIAQAGVDGDMTALDRAVELYHEVK